MPLSWPWVTSFFIVALLRLLSLPSLFSLIGFLTTLLCVCLSCDSQSCLCDCYLFVMAAASRHVKRNQVDATDDRTFTESPVGKVLR